LVTVLLASNLTQVSFGGVYVSETLIVAYGSVRMGGRTLPFVAGMPLNSTVLKLSVIDTGYEGAVEAVAMYGGGFKAVGWVRGGVGARSILLADVDPSLNVREVKLIGGGGEDYGSSVLAVDDGILIAGNTRSYGLISGTDILLLLVNGTSNDVLEARVVGVPGYEDYAYRLYRFGDDIVLIGTTWSYNVSVSDCLIVLLDGGAHLKRALTIGGPGIDDAYFLSHLDGGWLLGGSTYSVEERLSDAYIALLDENWAERRVVAVGWEKYDGFVDASGENVQGHAFISGEMSGLIAVTDGYSITQLYRVRCGGEAPIPIKLEGHGASRLLAFQANNSLIMLQGLERGDQSPRALIAGSAQVTVDKLAGWEDALKDVTDSWSVKEARLTEAELAGIRVLPARFNVTTLWMPVAETGLMVGAFDVRPPLTKVALDLLRFYSPVIVLTAPIIAVIAVWLARKLRALRR